MKTIYRLIMLCLISINVIFAQAQQPTGTPIYYPSNSNPVNNQAWFRGGNLPGEQVEQITSSAPFGIRPCISLLMVHPAIIQMPV
jgi:hypothetical protein